MKRVTDPSSIQFPVELRPIGIAPGQQQKDEESSFGEIEEEYSPIDTHKAVVRVDNGAVFAIVSDKYRLLHNSHALQMGKRAFCHLFPDAKESDFEIYDIRQTKTGSACHVDLIHNSWKIDVWDQETWLPYLRVANSYNRSRALTFDFGFVRSLCSNGIIFQKETIRAKFYHTKGELNLDLSQEPEFEKLQELANEFTAYMKRLHRIKVAKELLLPMCLYLLDLDFDLESEDSAKRHKEVKRLDEVRQSLGTTLNHYTEELGENGYTALNAASDLATHNPGCVGNFANTADLQEEIGMMLRELLGTPDTENPDRLGRLLLKQVKLLEFVA